LGDGDDAPGAVEHDESCARRALIDCTDVICQSGLPLSSCGLGAARVASRR
jgi:hypothetical protein